MRLQARISWNAYYGRFNVIALCPIFFLCGFVSQRQKGLFRKDDVFFIAYNKYCIVQLKQHLQKKLNLPYEAYYYDENKEYSNKLIFL